MIVKSMVMVSALLPEKEVLVCVIDSTWVCLMENICSLNVVVSTGEGLKMTAPVLSRTTRLPKLIPIFAPAGKLVLNELVSNATRFELVNGAVATVAVSTVMMFVDVAVSLVLPVTVWNSVA